MAILYHTLPIVKLGLAIKGFLWHYHAARLRAFLEEIYMSIRTAITTAKEMLEHTTELVGGDRAHTHGDKVANHENIATLWSGYLFNKGPALKNGVGAEDVANMMELMKIARRQAGAFNPDDYADGAGYAAVAFECGAAMEAARDAAREAARSKPKVTAENTAKQISDEIRKNI